VSSLHKIAADSYATGEENMAADLELLERVRSGELEAAFRTYMWKPWAVSLGRHQSVDAIDADIARSKNIDVVVRPTGGRAVLHAEELTYCIVARGRPRAIYARVHEVLSQALRSLGAKDLHDETDEHLVRQHYRSSSPLGQACFAANAQHEVLFEGRKIIGSAQRIVDGVVLQHGSILCGDAHLMLAELVRSVDDRSAFRNQLNSASASLSQVLQRAVDPSEVQQALHALQPTIAELLNSVADA